MKSAGIFTLILLIGADMALAQQPLPGKDWYFKLSGGYVSFGTGVLDQTYGVGFDVSKNVVKHPGFGMGRLLLGGEFLFEQGVSSPKMGLLSPTDAQGPFTSFYHVSASTLWPKVSYYPFAKTFAGFNVQAGPTIGYTYFSRQISSSLILDPPTGGAFRRVALDYDHGVRVGYRISTGYEFAIGKKWLAGFRADFSNTQKGEINTMLGAKAGIRF